MSNNKEALNPWRAITLEELAKHNDLDNNDAWLAIKGIVYDVSTYASKHPGGAAKIRKYAGKDATETFNVECGTTKLSGRFQILKTGSHKIWVHAYVDPVSILGGLQVAILKGPGGYQRSCMEKILWPFGKRNKYKPPSTYFKQDSIVSTYIVEFANDSQEYDWTVGVTEKRHLHVFKCIGTKKVWLSLYDLPEQLENDELSINFRSNYKHIHITLRKPIPTAIWVDQTHGLKINGKFVQITEGHRKFDAYITHKKCLTQNIIMFGVQIVSSARIGVPLGFHVELHHGEICRPYTPVCLVVKDDNATPHSARAREKKQLEEVPVTVLYFMIKIYPNGAFTKLLDDIELDDGRQLPTLQVSTPHGHFNPEFLHDFSGLFLLSAGTGITPMTRILQRFWHCNEKLRSKRIVLWHFVQKEHDLIWKKELQDLEEVTIWFNYFPVLTRADSKWQGLKERVCPELLTSCISKLGLEKRGATKACICGPPGFNSAAVS